MAKFIPIEKMKKLRDSSRGGDIKAKKILSMYMSGKEDYSPLLEEYFKPLSQEKEETLGTATNRPMPQQQTNLGGNFNSYRQTLQSLTESGDTLAQNILKMFSEAGEEKTNEFLSKVAVSQNNKENKLEKCQTLVEFVQALVEDENEAIQGYDKAILFTVNSETDRNILSILNEIKNDEIRHIKMLKEII